MKIGNVVRLIVWVECAVLPLDYIPNHQRSGIKNSSSVSHWQMPVVAFGTFYDKVSLLSFSNEEPTTCHAELATTDTHTSIWQAGTSSCYLLKISSC